MSLDQFKQLNPVRDVDLTLPRTHRFRNSPIYQDGEGREFFESFVTYFIPEDPTDQYFTVPPGAEGRLDLISHHVYGTSKYWWILVLANDIVDPFDDVVEGMILRYPSRTRLFTDNLLSFV